MKIIFAQTHEINSLLDPVLRGVPHPLMKMLIHEDVPSWEIISILLNVSEHTRGSSLLSQSCSPRSNAGPSGRDDPARIRVN